MKSAWSSSCCFLLIARLVLAQRTTFPPTLQNYPPDASEGSFSRPSLDQGQIFQNGSKLTVTWTSTYAKANLFLIADDVFWYPNWLLMNTTQTSYDWTVNDLGNNTSFFRFRLINGLGTEDEQAVGGFTSGAFYIADQALVNRIAATATTATTASTATLAVTTSTKSSTSTSVSTSVVLTMAAPTMLHSNSTGTAILSSPIASTVTVSSTPAVTAATSSETNTGSGTSIAMVAGVSIGAGVLLIALTAGLVFFLFRRRRRDVAGDTISKALIDEPPQYVRDASYSASDSPKEVSGNSCVVEMPGNRKSLSEAPAGACYFEAPGHTSRPQELPADYGGATFNNGRNPASRNDWSSKPLPATHDNFR